MEDIGVILPGVVDEAKDKRPMGEGAYELIIVGAGPAGMTAAVYSSRKKLRTLLVSKDLGGQPLLTSEIENYMGYQYVTGPELMAKFHEQVKQFPIDVIIGEGVTKLTAQDDEFTVSTRTGKGFVGKAVIIASGKRSRQLDVSGEKELVGRGVTYCSICDAPLFAGMDVAVIGGGNSALTAVVDLIKIAARIYVVNVAAGWQADPILVEKAEVSQKVIPFLGYMVKEILSEERVSGLVIESREAGETQQLAVGGVFIEIGLVPNSELARGLLALNKVGEIVVDCSCRTSVPGIFAAGDVTNVPEKQIIVAAGEGANASLSAYSYLLRR